MRKLWTGVLGLGILACPLGTHTQTTDDLAAKSTKQARAILDAMVQALGGGWDASQLPTPAGVTAKGTPGQVANTP